VTSVCSLVVQMMMTTTTTTTMMMMMSNIPGNHEVRELQKTAILGTAHIFRKVLT
jgi:hypothetical protein